MSSWRPRWSRCSWPSPCRLTGGSGRSTPTRWAPSGDSCVTVAPLTVVVPLVAAGLLTAVAVRLNRAVAEVVAPAATLATVTFCVILLARTASGSEVYWFGGWETHRGIAVGVAFVVDAFGAGLATLCSVLMVAALVLMWRYRDTEPPHFQTLMLLFLAGMVGFCLSGDLFNMFVFFELMSVAAFALAGYKIDEDEAVEGSLNFAVTNTIGSFLILTGIALVYGRTGVLNLAQISGTLLDGPHDGLVVVAFCLLAAGFFVKAAVVPFHFWLADAYAVAPTPVCLLFAGAMSELGIYAVGRIWFAAFEPALGEGAPELRVVLIIAGCLTALVGAVMCLAQDHLKRMLAFATISYVGVFLIGLGLLSPVGVAGAALFVAADGFGKAALVGAVGVLQHAGRQVSEVGLRGAGRTLPLAGLAFALGAASFAAIPPFGTFFAKAVLEDGLVEEGHAWAIPVLIVASALTAAAVLRAGGRIFLGWGRGGGASRSDRGEAEEEGPPERPPLAMIVPTLLLGLAALALGLLPGAVEQAHEAAMRFADGGAYAEVVLGRGDVPRPEAAPVTASTSAYAYAALTLTAAMAVAALALFDRAVPGGAGARIKDTAARVVAPLRALHSGHIGDYVSFLVFGSAVLGGALAISLG